MRIQLLPHKAYTYYELAQFFNITPTSFKVHKFEKLEELKNYASFHEINNSIIIDKVICSYYLGTLTERKAFRRMIAACINNNIVNDDSSINNNNDINIKEINDQKKRE